ncbi:RDD family protein [Rarobacter incanus]|uniref:RDD family protein n=1 Tax=Rarobacter incanus TaxID=153494 RepID=A0A542SMX6_9MICO|nr:RDD family protein [Rarobacter incanus]TQK75855.1 RDD family protein [Rarobacter incanus]
MGEGGSTNTLGLPPQGPGSRARLGRRIIALFIDWWASWLVGYLLFRGNEMAVLGIFAFTQWLLIWTMGASFGQRICSMQVRALAGRAPSTLVRPSGLAALIRTALLCLVIPAAVWDADGRGLHDKAAKTVLVRS